VHDPKDVFQKFKFEKTQPLNELKVEVANILGGTNVQLKFKVFSVKCIMPEVIAQTQDLELKNQLGLRKHIPKREMYRCEDDLSYMSGEVAWITCIEPCEYKKEMDDVTVTEVAVGLFTMDTQVCNAVKKKFPDSVSKDWGIQRVYNFTIKVGQWVVPYLWKFEPNVIINDKFFKPNMEADVLDQEKCYIRAKIEKVTDTNIRYKYEGKDYSTTPDNVHICGDKLPFTPCNTPTTKVIKVKFSSAMDMPVLMSVFVMNNFVNIY